MKEIAISDSAFIGEVIENRNRKGPSNVKRRSIMRAARKTINKKLRVTSAICCELNMSLLMTAVRGY
jgi:hypothetical protein